MDQCYTEKPRIHGEDVQLLAEPEVTKLAAVAKALSDPTRLQMICLLGQCPDVCTCEFEEILGLSQSKVSYHLKALTEVGIIIRKTYGTWSHYSLVQPKILDRLNKVVTPHTF